MNYKRINKPMARKYFNNGCTVLLLPCKVSDSVVTNPPHNYGFIQPTRISLDMHEEEEPSKFDRIVNEFEYYNCGAELGYYSHYFISEEDIQSYEKESVKNGSIKEESN